MKSENPVCCPKDSWPPLPQEGTGNNLTFEESGSEVKEGGTDLYVSGEGENCVIVNFDIFGWRKQTRIRFI